MPVESNFHIVINQQGSLQKNDLTNLNRQQSNHFWHRPGYTTTVFGNGRRVPPRWSSCLYHLPASPSSTSNSTSARGLFPVDRSGAPPSHRSSSHARFLAINSRMSGGLPVFCLQSLKHIRLGQLEEHQAGFGDTVLAPLGNGTDGHFAQFGNLGTAAEGIDNFGWCDHSAHSLACLDLINQGCLANDCLGCLTYEYTC